VLLPLRCKIPATTASPQEWRSTSKFTKVFSVLLYIVKTPKGSSMLTDLVLVQNEGFARTGLAQNKIQDIASMESVSGMLLALS